MNRMDPHAIAATLDEIEALALDARVARLEALERTLRTSLETDATG